MQLFDVNLLGVLAAAVADMIIGVIWYSPGVFGGRWKKLTGKETQKKVWEHLVAAAAALAGAYALALFIDASSSGNLMDGAFAGLLAGVCLAAAPAAVDYLSEKRSMELLLLTVGRRIVAFTFMGAIIGGLT